MGCLDRSFVGCRIGGVACRGLRRSGCRRRGVIPRFWRHSGFGVKLLGAFDDDLLACGKTAQHDPARSEGRPEGDGPAFGLVLGTDNIDEGIALAVALHRHLRDRERGFGNRLLDADADIKARQKVAVGVREFAAHRDLTGQRIDGRFGKEQAAGFVVDRAVVIDQTHACLARCGGNQLARLHRAAQLEHVRRGLREVGIDRIKLLDRRHDVGLRGDERAFGHQRAADDPRNGGGDIGVIEIELRLFQRGLRDRDLGVGDGQSGHGVFKIDPARDAALAQTFGALLLVAGVELVGLSAGKGRLRARDADAELRGIDAVKHIAFLDEAALFKDALEHDPADARANLGGAGRGDAAGKLADDGQRLGLEGDHADGRRGHLPPVLLGRQGCGRKHGGKYER